VGSIHGVVNRAILQIMEACQLSHPFVCEDSSENAAKECWVPLTVGKRKINRASFPTLIHNTTMQTTTADCAQYTKAFGPSTNLPSPDPLRALIIVGEPILVPQPPTALRKIV
jgi:hypothetical protein